ncbi:ATP-binding cassette domain-containing protein [Vagococcus salmoninarum]|uniref:ATP-binding cassette domain-containing protein n=1 Tax=Vagococcus salmoninarum TaxID=2739 RepID=UPI0018826EAA|nr:ATP-binding cassette domain-containing protein [Vagococcus salmoninarum]MBE9388574.1 ATP-binding cassette domain-containing protein [Vagococcus salmoninarum]
MAYIRLKNVSKKVKNRLLLNNVSLSIPKGSIATLEGINGSGKTVLLKAILGLLKTSGEIYVTEKKVLPNERYPIKAGILIENPAVVETMSAYKNLELLKVLQDEVSNEDIYDILKEMNLEHTQDEKVKNFSLGMKQKLGIGQAMLGNHPLIILDEPTNALDRESLVKLISYIKRVNEKGTTFIIASHDHEFINEVTTKRFLMREGAIVEK